MKKKRIGLSVLALVGTSGLLSGLLLSCAPRDKAISLGDAIDYLSSSVGHMADPDYFATLEGLSYSFGASLRQQKEESGKTLYLQEKLDYLAEPYTLNIGYEKEEVTSGSSVSSEEAAYGATLSKDAIGNYQLIESSSSAVYDTANPSYARYASYFALNNFIYNNSALYLTLASDCLSAIKDSTPNRLEDYRCLSSGKGNLVLYLYGGFDISLYLLSSTFPGGFVTFGSLDLIVQDFYLESVVFHLEAPTLESWVEDDPLVGNLSLVINL
jgi:hypothetical protein